MSVAPPPIETLLIDTLSGEDRTLLRHGAVLRYITRPLASVVTGSDDAAARLLGHPVVQGQADETWTIAEPLRRALLAGWAPADDIRSLVSEADNGLEGQYARLSASPTRPGALSELERQVGQALSAGDVPRAHDLIRLLDEWPVPDDPAACEVRDRLAPRLRRHSRALRDRDATTTYLERGFEDALWDGLVAQDGRWMLHLHAPGGRGKTMFVKNLLGRRCPAADIPVARIDFDHVTQLGLATSEPWLLLLAIAAQLDPQLPYSPFRYTLQKYGAYQDVVQPEALPRVSPATGVAADTRRDELAVEASREVPAAFRESLAAAVGNGLVVIALDTVENVLHTEGASIMPVLTLFEALRLGHPVGTRVPGLRVVISGRFDLAGERATPAGPVARVPGFAERWIGSRASSLPAGGAELVLGHSITTVEVPGFTQEEASRYLTTRGGITDPAMVAAIVARTYDNPMKLALLAEIVNRNRDVTARTIESFESVDLFYLADRVVDRIPDERVQWLLRWGALLPVLTREAVEQVIWPALEAFARTDAAVRADGVPGYDDARRDPLPPPPEDVSRWPVPDLAAVRAAGAIDRVWALLLDYASGSSWVSRLEDLDDAVYFHPEVRSPLRRLLRDGGHPAYDDIHRRAFEYWASEVPTATGASRATALRGVLFHAYQPWTGNEHDGDRLFGTLLAGAGEDRGERRVLGRAVLEITGPSAEVRSIAHLEIAEAEVDRATQFGTPVDESTLSYHLGEIGRDIRSARSPRLEFLHAVLADASGRVEECWGRLAAALPTVGDAEMGLVSGWLSTRTPPESGLPVVRRLLADHPSTQHAAGVARSLTRGLLAGEHWSEAYRVVRQADSADLLCATRIALGHALEVLERSESPRLWRARAWLLRYKAAEALTEIFSQPQSAAEALVAGQAYAQLGRTGDALSHLSEAASSSDPAVAVEATYELVRLSYREGSTDVSSSHLGRLSRFSDPLVALRSRLVEARLIRPSVLDVADRIAATIDRLPPSVAVELAITRLAVYGDSDSQLTRLHDALAAVEGAGARVLALRSLAEVRLPVTGRRSAVGAEIRGLVQFEAEQHRTAAAGLALADLERILGDQDAARRLLDGLSEPPDRDEPIARAVAEARARLEPPKRGPASDGETAVAGEQVTSVRLSAFAEDSISVRTGNGASAIIRMDDGAAELSRDADQLIGKMGLLLPIRTAWSTGTRIDLYFADPDTARWPWESAWTETAPPVLRRQRERTAPGDRPPPIATVLSTVLSEQSMRSFPLEALNDAYGGLATPAPSGLFRESVSRPPQGGVLHVVAEPVHRRGYPALSLAGVDVLTAETFAQRLPGGPWLVILDLDLSRYHRDAAEQLTFANAFSWYLVRAHRDVDVICGQLGDRAPSEVVRRLARGLGAGDSLTELAGRLQRSTVALRDNQPSWRGFVSVSTDHPDRRYRLDGAA